MKGCVMQLDLFPEEAEESVESGTMLCRKCNTVKPYSSFKENAVIYETQPREARTSSVCGVLRYCHECTAEYKLGRAIAGKLAPPKPTKDYPCDCCGTLLIPKKILLDHDHINYTFRGWLCRSCNTGIGALGDTIEGLERAIKYIENANEQH
jgi:hypothetical protein